MRTVLCDASPLIFLAKLDRPDLITAIFGEKVFALRLVIDLVGKHDFRISVDLYQRIIGEIESM